MPSKFWLTATATRTYVRGKSRGLDSMTGVRVCSLTLGGMSVVDRCMGGLDLCCNIVINCMLNGREIRTIELGISGSSMRHSSAAWILASSSALMAASFGVLCHTRTPSTREHANCQITLTFFLALFIRVQDRVVIDLPEGTGPINAI